jgi:phosphoglycolate phosphatase-like HAD superfamily hydrolase
MKALLDGIGAVLFDLDGTLVDSMTGFGLVAARVLGQHHALPFEEAKEAYRRTSGIPFFAQLEQLFPGDPRNTAAAAQFEAEKLAGMFEDPLNPGCLETLEGLRRRQGLRGRSLLTGVSSNNFQAVVDRFVAARNLPLDLVLAWRSPDFCKGAAHFAEVLRLTGLPSSALLFVGDSLADGQKAAQAKVRFAGLQGTFSKAEFQAALGPVPVLGSLPELLQ